MPNFLFEMLIEEIPHGVLPNTSQYIKDQIPKLLSKYGLTFASITYFITPRRLAFLIKDLPLNAPSRTIEQKGPSVKAAYDTQGNPTKALQGFLNSYNVSHNELEEREIKGQKYIFFSKNEEGQALSIILPKILQEFIQGIKFPQPMRWNYHQEVYEFIRPVRGITALIDNEILPVTFFGLQASNIIFGHRQLFPEAIILDHADRYETLLKQRGCIPQFEERQEIIRQKILEITVSIKGTPLLDDELLSILASLTEYPHPLLAEFDPEFLNLPKEVLISEMKVHQKYVPIVDEEGTLLPYYIITANIPYDDEETKNNILTGNNRVLRARFSDGQFFFQEDMKKGLTYYTEQLASIAFVDGAGSVADKVERMKSLALFLKNSLSLKCAEEDILQAISLAKADLSSLMVGEFPELQGIIGSYYALNQGIAAPIALAIKEHYYPMTVDGAHLTPTTELSALVGLVDRLDNLFTLYAVGKTVTGSRDPYALRRQTIAFIHILIQYQWNNFSLEKLFEKISPLYTPFLTLDQQEWQSILLDFIKVRLEGILKSEPYSFNIDTLNAVLTNSVDMILNDIARAEALQKVRTENQDTFARLIELFKRISNILKDQYIQELKESLLTEKAEQTLYQHYQQAVQKMAGLSYRDKLLELVKMEKEITTFFDSILVKTGDEKEINRIALLSLIQKLFLEQADFSKLS